MKKRIIFVFLLFVVLMVVGCKEKNPKPEGPTEEEINAAFTKAETEINNNLVKVTDEDLVLIDNFEGVEIEWDSDNDAIDIDGVVTVNRAKAVKVKLTYTLSYKGKTKEGYTYVIVTPTNFDKVAEEFRKQFSSLISRDYEINTVFYDMYIVDWRSSNTELFDQDGKYHKPTDDTKITITYTVRLEDEVSKEYSFSPTVEGVSDAEKLRELSTWLKDEAIKDLYLTDEIALPTKFEKYNIDIKWTSSNNDVISSEGVVKHYVFERYVTLIGSYELENGAGGSLKFEVIVSPLDTSKMSKEQIVENFLSAIAVTEYNGVKFGYAECPNLNQSFGSLYFYENKKQEVVEMLIPVGTSNRSQIPMDPQLVVIHDTANYNATALANAKYVQSGYSGTSTGWHYTVGNDGIYRTIPENEVGYHANGSGDTPLTWINTGIKATVRRPIVTVKDDYYIYINNVRTNVQVENKKPGVKFADDGVLCEIHDGYYHVAKPWWCGSHGFNANKGGNASGIGIETAVNRGSDYNTTIRILAKHVADILIRNNLTINRVVQHNTMSGKNCPQAIREAKFWYSFKDLVSMEKYAQENFADYNFVWTSNTSIMDNTGKISLDLQNEQKLSYSVKVINNGKTLVEKSYETKLGTK